MKKTSLKALPLALAAAIVGQALIAQEPRREIPLANSEYSVEEDLGIPLAPRKARPSAPATDGVELMGEGVFGSTVITGERPIIVGKDQVLLVPERQWEEGADGRRFMSKPECPRDRRYMSDYHNSLDSLLPEPFISNREEDYDDLYAWCSNAITLLGQARALAEDQARHGQYKDASNSLMQALHESLSGRGADFDAAPHTWDAIKVAYAILKTTYKSTAAEIKKDPTAKNLVFRVRYAMGLQVYKLIHYAYFKLDEQYYNSVVLPCRGRNCYGRGEGRPPFFNDYVDGVKNLAKLVLKLQIESGEELQAFDAVELNVARVVVKGARDLLRSSLMRRSMACTIQELHFIAQRISYNLSECGGGNPRRRPQYVRWARGMIERVYNDASAWSCTSNRPGRDNDWEY